MLHLADRFKFMLLDDVAANLAQLVGRGATFWSTADGGMGTALDAKVFTIDRRQAGQVINLLGIRPGHAPQRLGRGDLPEHLHDVLEIGQSSGEGREGRFAAAMRPAGK